MESQKLTLRNPFVAVKHLYWGNKMNEQRLTLMLFVSLGTLTGSFMAFTGLLGDNYMGYKMVNLAVFIVVMAINLLFLFRHLSLYHAVGLAIIACSVSICGGMVCFSLPGPFFSDRRAMADISLALVLGICSVHAYLRYTSTIVCLLALACYVACIQFTESDFLRIYFPFFIVIALSGLALGYVLVRNVRQINDENVHLQQETQRIRANLDLNAEQFQALMELASEQEPEKARVGLLLEQLGPKARKRLFERLREIMHQKETQMGALERIFPEFTESELSICRLILQDKRLSEICTLLGKTKSNITCQRSHIRAKLGLTPEVDLRDALRERMAKAVGNEKEG